MKGRSCFIWVLAAAVLFFIDTAHPLNAASIPTLPATASINSAPVLSGSARIHVVRRGDNLIKLSREFETTPEVLKSVNGLRDSTILIGQELRIPVPKRAGEGFVPPSAKNSPEFSYKPTMISQVLLQRDAQKEMGKILPPRIRLIKAGFEMLGVRYRFSGRSKKYGFDCSGLVTNLYSKFDIELPHSSREQFRYGEKVTRDRLEEGDLVFFSSQGRHPDHVGIYIGNDQFLHAARKAKKVIVSDLNQLWYAVRFLGARRIADLWGDD
jgi:LysM repeat protein